MLQYVSDFIALKNITNASQAREECEARAIAEGESACRVETPNETEGWEADFEHRKTMNIKKNKQILLGLGDWDMGGDEMDKGKQGKTFGETDDCNT